MKGKMVTFVAASGPGTVTIDCNGTGFAVVMVSTETIETVIDGFVFTNCQGDSALGSSLNPPLPLGSGGAVVFAGAARGLIKNCIIRLNSASVAGGGVLVHTTNVAAGTGPTLTNTTLERNSAKFGAAVSVSAGTLTLNECRFQVVPCTFTIVCPVAVVIFDLSSTWLAWKVAGSIYLVAMSKGKRSCAVAHLPNTRTRDDI